MEIVIMMLKRIECENQIAAMDQNKLLPVQAPKMVFVNNYW